MVAPQTAPAAISFQCAECGRTVRVPAARAGQTGPCPQCKSPVTVPAAPGAGVVPEGVFDPMKVGHIPLRVSYYGEKIARRQRRLERYLTREEAREFVLGQYHEHTVQIGTLVMIGLLALAGLSVLQDGFAGALKVLGGQLLWAGPMGGLLYGVGRYLLVPPAPKEHT